MVTFPDAESGELWVYLLTELGEPGTDSLVCSF